MEGSGWFMCYHNTLGRLLGDLCIFVTIMGLSGSLCMCLRGLLVGAHVALRDAWVQGSAFRAMQCSGRVTTVACEDHQS